MKKLFLILLTCLSLLPASAASFGHITVFISDFPQFNPTDSFNLFASDIAGSSAGTAGPLILTEGGQVYYFAGGSVPRMEIGGRNPLTTFTVRGTPVLNFGLGYFNDTHAWNGSSGTGPELYGAVGLQSVFRIGMTDNITPDNAYNVDVSAIGGVINTFQHRNLRLSSVDSAGGLLPQVVLSHAGFVAFPYGLIQGTDTNLVFQGDTNALGVGGLISIEPSPTKYLNIGGGVKHNFRSSSATTTVATNDYFILATSSINVTNMDASDVLSGRTVWVGADAGVTATIIPQAGDTIEGASTYTVTGGSESAWVELVSNGAADWKASVKPPTASSSGYDTIKEDGTPLAQESAINFIGTTLTAAPGTGETTVTSDADVDALASNSSNGLWARTGSGTGAARTITAGDASVTVTNGDGAAGNPTIALSANNVTTFSKTLNNNATNHIFTVTLASGGMSGLIVEGNIAATDTVDFQSFTAQWSVATVNNSGVFSHDVDEGNTSQAVSGGLNMVPIVTFDDNGSNAYVFVLDPVSLLTTTSVIFRYTIKNLTGQTITIH